MSPRRRALSAILLAVLASAGCAESTATSDTGGDTPSGPIKIGAVLDITGAGASLGVPERQALELLSEQLEAKGGVGGRPVQLVVEDNQSTEAGAAKAMTKLVTQDRVDIVIGASRVGPSLAMKPAAASSRTPMISLAANQKVVDDAPWVFKTAPNDRVQVERMVDHMAAEGYRTVGLARDASAFGEGVQELIDEVGRPAGVRVVATEKFATDATDFTAQMVNLRSADADVNVVWGIPPAAGLAMKSYRQLGIDKPVMQTAGIGNQAFLDSAGPAGNGLVAPLGALVVADQLPATDPQRPVITKFIADYTKRWGQAPSTFSGHAYDAWTLSVQALEAVGTDRQKIRDHLERAELVGISGSFRMSPQDHSGLSKDTLRLVTVQDGRFRLLPGQDAG